MKPAELVGVGQTVPDDKQISVVYHPYVEADLQGYQKLSNSYGFGSSLDINDISAESVIQKIDQIMKTKYEYVEIQLGFMETE